MKRILLAVFTCLLMTTSATMAKSLVLTLKDGTLVYYLLGGDVDPMIYFVDGGVEVNADGYSFANLKNIYISNTDDPNGIEQRLTHAQVNYSGNVLVVSAQVQTVKVYAVNGAEVQANVRSQGDALLVDLNPLPHGNYVVQVGESSFKVMKR